MSSLLVDIYKDAEGYVLWFIQGTDPSQADGAAWRGQLEHLGTFALDSLTQVDLAPDADT